MSDKIFLTGMTAIGMPERPPASKYSAPSSLAAPSGSAEWLPIQLAPKDGTRVLLWCGDEVEVGYWSTSSWVRNMKPDGTLTDGAWIIYENRSDTIELAPTHWMALPLPPNVGAETPPTGDSRQPKTL